MLKGRARDVRHVPGPTGENNVWEAATPPRPFATSERAAQTRAGVRNRVAGWSLRWTFSIAMLMMIAMGAGTAAWGQTAPAEGAPPAQPPATTPDPTAAKVPQKAIPRPKAPEDPVVDESFSIRLDEDLYQLEEAVTLIAASLNQVADITPTMAINSFHFGKEIDPDFRRKAEVIILDKLFLINPNIRLVACQECQKLETKIERGVLKLRKGIPSQESRQDLAQKLGVDGFIDIGMFSSEGQLTVYLKVQEARSGAIVLVDELAGRRAPMRRALTFSFGEMIFPLTLDGGEVIDHRALILSVQESVKLTGRFSFAVDVIAFVDNNENNPETTFELNSGLLLAPTLGFDIIQVPSSTSRLILFLGIGKLIHPQLDYANLARGGLEMIVGDRLSVLFAYNSFLEANVDATDSDYSTVVLDGGGYEVRFGYRF